MYKHKTAPFIILLSVFYFTGLFSQQQNVFEVRRQKVIDNMPANCLMIIKTSKKGYRFGFNFQQNSNLFYLTGLADEGITLLLSKNAINYPDDNSSVFSILLLNPPASKTKSDSFYQTLQDSLQFDLVCSPMELRKILKKVNQVDFLYTNIIKQNQIKGSSILEKRLLKFVDNFPDIKFHSPTTLTNSLRRIKNEDEIILMQKAIDITMKAHLEAFKSMEPGLFEHQIEAVVEYVFKFSGSEQLAFPTIVGAGPNSIVLHYEEGVRKIQPGDMIVMDIGCEFDHYCADITRTIPADGKFNPQQKEIYNIVLEANLEIIKNLSPGFTLAQMDSVQRAVIGKYGYEKYVRHGPTHYLGLDVHDVGDWKEPLQPGCVVTVEPGIYISSNSDLPKEYWNIGIRIEDDVLITEDGCRVLTNALPKTIEKIEEIMKNDGLGNITF
ncbi:aminopeptidase P N-terminal domain-containing protein [candidate division KSB1 bacterium]|nr:aminopeptidase P N-terminal domain-containing protein [candidate division KSB1 bacterium]